jgi:hypothetical protein
MDGVSGRKRGSDKKCCEALEGVPIQQRRMYRVEETFFPTRSIFLVSTFLKVAKISGE